MRDAFDIRRSRAALVPVLLWGLTVLGAAACVDGTRTNAVDADAGDVRDTGGSTPDTEVGDAGDTAEAGATADADAGDVADDADASRHRGPPYPIVLAHGFGGFEHLADVDELEYWYKIPEVLRNAGETVKVAEVDPFDDSYKRGRQLLNQIVEYTRKNGWRKVHIIAHSQGGLDARYAAHHRSDLVASVVTISTPHEGTRISDIVLEIAEYENTQEVINAVAEFVGRELYDKSGDETAVVEALRQFSEPGIKKFNKRITDQPGVYYASVAGRSDSLLGIPECETPNAPQFIEDWESTTDPVSPVFATTEPLLDGPTGTDANDGLVRVDKAKWGEFLGCIPADHLDEVGQLLGDHPGGFNDWEYRDFYRKLADFLHKRYDEE